MYSSPCSMAVERGMPNRAPIPPHRLTNLSCVALNCMTLFSEISEICQGKFPTPANVGSQSTERMPFGESYFA